MSCQHLFVYGTLRRPLTSPMDRVLVRHAKFVCGATFEGKLFDVKGYPGVVPAAGRGDRVIGDVHRIGNEAALFAALDDYEMCSDRYPEPREYRREVVEVTRDDGRRLPAWIYLYNLPTGLLRRIESGDFLAR